MLNTFSNFFLDKRFSIGKNILKYHHFKKCIENLLKELLRIEQFGDYQILETEKQFLLLIQFLINGEKKPINFVGQIDRVDSTKDSVRLVDYKTGLVRKIDLTVNGLNQLYKKDKAFQLFFYGLLWNENNLNDKDVTCQVITLKTPFYLI